MKRTALNNKARKKIAAIAQRKNLIRCEVELGGCMGSAHAPAHRHKRSWYYDKDDSLLWDFSQWLACCQSCHNKLEFNKELTEKVFEELRGEEKI